MNAEAPLLPVTRVTTLAAIDASQRSVFRRAMTGAASGGLVALLLSAIGLYAVVSFAVNQRTREIGIRTALRADPRQVTAMFFKRGLGLSFYGLLIGLSVSAVVIRITTLARGREMDWSLVWIGLIIAAVVVAVSSLATWFPARHAARVDPLTMLRAE